MLYYFSHYNILVINISVIKFIYFSNSPIISSRLDESIESSSTTSAAVLECDWSVVGVTSAPSAAYKVSIEEDS